MSRSGTEPREAGNNTDSLGVRARVADYAGLNFLNRQEPAGQDPAIVHGKAFKDGLEAQIAEWMLFDQGGDRLDDPVVGYTVTASGPPTTCTSPSTATRGLVRLGEGTERRTRQRRPQESVELPGPVQSWLADGLRTAPGQQRLESVPCPGLALTYLDQNNKLAQMSIIRHQEGDDAPGDRLQHRPPGREPCLPTSRR